MKPALCDPNVYAYVFLKESFDRSLAGTAAKSEP